MQNKRFRTPKKTDVSKMPKITNGKGQSKYNWPLIKVEFFNSDYLDVKPFMEDRYGGYHNAMAVKGWAEHKARWLESVQKKALQISSEKMAKELNRGLDEIRGYFVELGENARKLKLKPSDAYIIWEVLRTENALPVRYTKNVHELKPSFTAIEDRTRELLEKRGIKVIDLTPKEDGADFPTQIPT